VGFNSVTVPAATDSSHPSNIVTSCPFYQPAVFQGATSAVGANTFSFTGTTLTTTLTAPPYLARVKSGPSAGRFFVISSVNSDTQVTLTTTVHGQAYSLTTSAPANSSQLQVAVGDSVEICPANTFGSLFPNGGPFLAGTSTATADVVWLWNGSTWDQYFYDATAGVVHWRKSPGIASANQNGTVILPDQAMFVTRRGLSAITLTFLGATPSTQEQTDFPGAGTAFVANRFPVGVTLGGTGATALNLQNLPNWQSNSDVTQADQVQLWNGASWDTYFYDTGVAHWRKSPGIASFNANSVAVPISGGMFVIRKSSAQGSTSTLVQALPYSLN